jgi:hypothetical protein
MIIKVMFHIQMKLKSELARAPMTTSDVNNQWRSNGLKRFITTLNLQSIREGIYLSFFV